MSEDKNCFFCRSECEIHPASHMHSARKYECRYCGSYLLDDFLIACVSEIKETKNKFKIACVLNERRLRGLGGVAFSGKTDTEEKICTCPQVSVDDILEEFPRKASDFLDRTLLNLSRLPEQPFEVINLNMAIEGNRLSLFVPDQKGCYAFLRELAAQGFIRFNQVAGGPQWDVFFLTIELWEMVESLQKEEVDNKRAFVAMWFDESMDAYYKNGIKQAIEDAGYVAVRIDLQNFNEKICDEIIAEIRRTRFLIADFTGLRSGVFFEAGFAKGLGREVIFTVRETDIEELKLHLDTRQYNHIVYDSPADLRRKLYNRIRATIA